MKERDKFDICNCLTNPYNEVESNPLLNLTNHQDIPHQALLLWVHQLEHQLEHRLVNQLVQRRIRKPEYKHHHKVDEHVAYTDRYSCP